MANLQVAVNDSDAVQLLDNVQQLQGEVNSDWLHYLLNRVAETDQRAERVILQEEEAVVDIAEEIAHKTDGFGDIHPRCLLKGKAQRQEKIEPDVNFPKSAEHRTWRPSHTPKNTQHHRPLEGTDQWTDR